MTETKAKRLKQELVDRYGADKVLVLYYDAYFPYKEGSRVSEQICENDIKNRKIHTFKCLVTGDISLSWNLGGKIEVK